MAARRKSDESDRPRRPPATTPEGRENQLIALAYDLVEKKMLDGTASSQETSLFLKMGSSREKLEQERLAMEVQLLAAKKENLESAARVEELLTDAMKAFSGYRTDADDIPPMRTYDD